MRLAIVHETIYRFDEPCSRAIQTLRLTPRNTESQLVQRWRIDVSQDCRLSPVEDAFGIPTNSYDVGLIVASEKIGGITLDIDNLFIARTIGFK